jgi:hypothetical protein
VSDDPSSPPPAAPRILPRGAVVFAHVDINTPSERGSHPDGSDRHAVKCRPIVIWQIRDGGDVEAVPVSTELGDAGDDGAGRDTVITAGLVLGQRLALMRRLVLVRGESVEWSGTRSTLGAAELARLKRLIRTGEINDLTAHTGVVAAENIFRRGAAAADRALDELRRRRQATIAALERQVRRSPAGVDPGHLGPALEHGELLN